MYKGVTTVAQVGKAEVSQDPDPQVVTHKQEDNYNLEIFTKEQWVHAPNQAPQPRHHTPENEPPEHLLLKVSCTHFQENQRL